MERVPCPPDICNTDACPVFESVGRCFEDVHHKQWPRRVIKRLGRVATEWRELDENKQQTCRAAHNELHATTPPPVLPDIPTMREAINNARVAEVAERAA